MTAPNVRVVPILNGQFAQNCYLLAESGSADGVIDRQARQWLNTCRPPHTQESPDIRERLPQVAVHPSHDERQDAAGQYGV